jgi:hypothetical protein
MVAEQGRFFGLDVRKRETGMKGTVRQLRSFAIAALGVMLLSPAGAEPPPFTPTQTFVSPSPTVFDEFGFSVAISGDNVLVGAPLDDAGAIDSGAAYLFDAGTGNLLRTFLNPAPGLNDEFGKSVAISGDNVLVGAPLNDAGATDSGAVYLFDAGSGNLLRTLLNPTLAASDFFGWSVAISGDNILVGAFLDNAGGLGSGAAYLYEPIPVDPVPWLELLLLD